MEQEVTTLYDYLDSVDLLRDAADTDARLALSNSVQLFAPLLTVIILRELRQNKQLFSRELKKLVIPSVTKLLSAYRAAAKGLGEAFASLVLAKIEKVQKATKPKPKDEVEERLVLNLDSLTEVYVLELKSVARNLLLGGLSETEVTRQLEENIRATGRETGAYFNAISSDVKSAIFQIADQAAQDAFAFENLQDRQRWITFFGKSCPDCRARHNLVKSYDEWLSEGLPRSGATVCRQHCHCVLLPDKYPVKIAQPLPRERAKIE